MLAEETADPFYGFLFLSIQAVKPAVPVPPKASPQPAQAPQTVTPSAVLPPLESEKAKAPQALTKVTETCN